MSAPFIRESDIRRAICKALTRMGRTFWNTSGNHSSQNTAGTPDIVVCVGKGLCVALEVKTPKGKLTDRQQYLTAGGEVFIVRSVDEAISIVQEMQEKARAINHTSPQQYGETA